MNQFCLDSFKVCGQPSLTSAAVFAPLFISGLITFPFPRPETPLDMLTLTFFFIKLSFMIYLKWSFPEEGLQDHEREVRASDCGREAEG